MGIAEKGVNVCWSGGIFNGQETPKRRYGISDRAPFTTHQTEATTCAAEIREDRVVIVADVVEDIRQYFLRERHRDGHNYEAIKTKVGHRGRGFQSVMNSKKHIKSLLHGEGEKLKEEVYRSYTIFPGPLHTLTAKLSVAAGQRETPKLTEVDDGLEEIYVRKYHHLDAQFREIGEEFCKEGSVQPFCSRDWLMCIVDVTQDFAGKAMGREQHRGCPRSKYSFQMTCSHPNLSFCTIFEKFSKFSI
ncbi:hypothetical protein C8F04DRAFT_1180943 [Mycena alexandri]|uniref:Uncharacterized protein n=1 Tax=Mycena alexandri TaxID=1745969 RepID=A0AAD6X6N5_9AGAR|nr:hypothetical protein C8F04DRAFT_1180943 [Mycena alexandri]